MNRFGKIAVGLLALALVALASMVRFTDAPASSRPISKMAEGATPAEPQSGAPLAIPVAGVRPDALVDSFDDARGGGTRPHHAIDILAPQGTPVFAAAAGRVEKLFDSKLGGLMVYVRAGPAFVHYYGHLAGYAPGLAEGQSIGAGTPIGFVGATGDADPGAPHLHFGVKRMAPGDGWWQGTDIDPYPLLAGNAGAR